MREKKNLSYRSKLLLQLMAMSILPILIFTFYSYYMLRKDMVEKMDLMSFKRAERVQERFDNLMTSIRGSYFDIFETDAVRNVMAQELSYRDYSIYAEAIDQLQGYSYLKDYIRGFSFINLETDWVLSNRGMYPFSKADNQKEILELAKGKDCMGMLLKSTKEFTENSHHDTIDVCGVYLLFELPVIVKPTECILIVNLNMKTFQEFVDEQDDYEITVLDKDNRLLITTDMIIADYLGNHMKDIEAPCWVTLADGRKIRVGATITEAEFQYIVTYDSDLIEESGERVISFEIFLIIVFMITGFSGIIMRKHVYRPVLKLTDKISDAVQMERVKKDDALRFIEKNILDMTYTIRNQKEEIVRLLMSRLLTGSIQEEEIECYKKELDLEDFPYYCVMVLSLSAYSKWDQEIEDNALLKAINEGAVAELKEREILISEVWQGTLVFLVGISQKSQMREQVVRIQSLMEIYLKDNEIDKMQFGVSQCFQTLEHTLRAYNEAMEAIKVSEIECIRTGMHKLILYSDIAQSIDYASLPPVSAEVKIRELVDECREKEACVETERFIEGLYENRMPAVERRYYLYRLLFAILDVLHDAGLPVSELDFLNGNDIFFTFSRLYGSDNVKRFIDEQIIHGVICQLCAFRSMHKQAVNDKVITMIRKSKGDITLVECAEKLNYSPRHLERILRCENNEAFSNYVAEQKLAYAISLLEETESSVADIAKELNYSNTQNFIRFFNKRMGMSPGRYRQRQKSKACILVDNNQKQEGIYD